MAAGISTAAIDWLGDGGGSQGAERQSGKQDRLHRMPPGRV
jgi:hypothetical protein